MKFIDFIKPYFLKRIPLMLLSFLIAWVIHTYVMVAINQGFYGTPGYGVSNWIFSTGNGWSAFIIWTVIPFIIWYFVLTYVKYGKDSVVSKFTKTPSLIFKKLGKTNRLEKQSIAIGFLSILLISLLININKQAGISLALLFTLFSISSSGIKISKLFFKVWKWLKKVFEGGVEFSDEVEVKEVYLYMLGFIPAFVLVGFLPTFLKIGILVIAIAFLVYINKKDSEGTGGETVILFFLTTAFIVLHVTFAFADDGGLAECGGTWEEWIRNCPGRAETLVRGSEVSAAAGATPTAADPVTETDETAPIAELDELLGFEVD